MLDFAQIMEIQDYILRTYDTRIARLKSHGYDANGLCKQKTQWIRRIRTLMCRYMQVDIESQSIN